MIPFEHLPVDEYQLLSSLDTPLKELDLSSNTFLTSGPANDTQANDEDDTDDAPPLPNPIYVNPSKGQKKKPAYASDKPAPSYIESLDEL